jgi:hypothetical protein
LPKKTSEEGVEKISSRFILNNFSFPLAEREIREDDSKCQGNIYGDFLAMTQSEMWRVHHHSTRHFSHVEVIEQK